MGICDLIGIMGCLISLGVKLCLLFPLNDNKIQTDTIKTFTQSYYLLGIIQSIFYAGYGYQNNDNYILTASIIGIITFFAYLNINIYIFGPYKHFLYFNFGLVLLLFLSLTSISKDADLYLAVSIACFWQSSNIPNLRLALLTKDISFVNIILSYCSVVNFFIWLIYSLIYGIYLLSLDSIVTIVFMSVNIYIYYWGIGHISDEDPFIVFLHKWLLSSLFDFEFDGGNYNGKIKEEEQEFDLSAKLKELNSDIFYRN